MKSGTDIFEDAFALQKQHPLTFQIPTEAQLRRIREGDLVKVAAKDERFWLNVAKAEFPHFEGRVANNLFFAAAIGMDYGDSVAFEARHIYDIDTVEQQETAKRMEAIAPAKAVAPGIDARTVSPANNRPPTLPPWVVESCPQCMHGVRMGFPIPENEITLGIAALLCPNCRAELPFEKLGCPISHEQLMELCDYVEEQFTSRQGDETLRFAGEFCDREHLPKEQTLDWLRGQGGYCDIEVVMNVAPRWAE